MGLEIVELAIRMFEAFMVTSVEGLDDLEQQLASDFRFNDLDLAERRAWLAAAKVARPDLAEGVRVAPDHWAAGVLAVACELRNCAQPRGHEGPHFAPVSTGEAG